MRQKAVNQIKFAIMGIAAVITAIGSILPKEKKVVDEKGIETVIALVEWQWVMWFGVAMAGIAGMSFAFGFILTALENADCPKVLGIFTSGMDFTDHRMALIFAKLIPIFLPMKLKISDDEKFRRAFRNYFRREINALGEKRQQGELDETKFDDNGDELIAGIDEKPLKEDEIKVADWEKLVKSLDDKFNNQWDKYEKRSNAIGFYCYYFELKRRYICGLDEEKDWFERGFLRIDAPYGVEFHPLPCKDDLIYGFERKIQAGIAWLDKVANINPNLPLIKIGRGILDAWKRQQRIEQASSALDEKRVRDAYINRLRSQDKDLEQENEILRGTVEDLKDEIEEKKQVIEGYTDMEIRPRGNAPTGGIRLTSNAAIGLVVLIMLLVLAVGIFYSMWMSATTQLTTYTQSATKAIGGIAFGP